MYCRTGHHLQACNKVNSVKTYKCPGYYCLLWKYVCDGHWDCPGGYDEYGCLLDKHKPGFLKCSHSNPSILIQAESVCDDIIDCPEKEDENFCELKSAKCPSMCFCVVYGLFL